MRDSIISGINSPAELERLYRKNKTEFKQHFKSVYDEFQDLPIVQFWHERLNYETRISTRNRSEFIFVILASLLAGLLAKLPGILNISEEFYYPRNIGFLVFPFLTAYFLWKNKVSGKLMAVISLAMIACALYINFLPDNMESDTLLLACIHLPILLWGLFGISYSSKETGNLKKRLEFLGFNGDLLVMSALLVLAGALMTGISIGLFKLIGIQIENFYFEYVVIFALPAIPIIAAFLTQSNRQLVSRVSPVIAKIFSPLVLVMLVIYLGAIIYSGKDPYNDREFLMLFNLLLIGVMVLIFFSLAESSARENSAPGRWILFLLSIVTIIVNAIALSAILFRISEWGFTPNRVAVLGANVLILIHLLIVSFRLYQTLIRKTAPGQVGKAIASYLPVYFVWIIIVVFLFPLIFNFK